MEGRWSHAADDPEQRICDVCPRACRLKPDQRGFCFVRQNVGGKIVSTTYGRSMGFCIDPVEKKPLNHFFPGSAVLSFGTAGCNLGCRFCQNWSMSKSREMDRACEVAAPETIAAAAKQLHCRGVAFTYNDPIVWAEYAIDTAAACRQLGVKTVAVTSGYISSGAREAFFASMDAANIDLKGYRETFYHELTGGHLQPVLDTLRYLVHETDVWVEITNLVIPGANDGREDLERLCMFVADELGVDVPVHFTAFHPDFKMRDRGPTPPATLREARDLAQAAGLRYVYTGNIADPDGQSTYCPACGRCVLGRDGYAITTHAVRDGACGYCGQAIAGHFDDEPGRWGARRRTVRIGHFATESPPKRNSP